MTCKHAFELAEEFRAPLKTYRDRDESNFDFEQGTLRTGGLEALRAQINAAQNQKCFGLKDLPLLCAGGVARDKAGFPAQPLAREPCLHRSKSAISAHGRFSEVP